MPNWEDVAEQEYADLTELMQTLGLEVARLRRIEQAARDYVLAQDKAYSARFLMAGKPHEPRLAAEACTAFDALVDTLAPLQEGSE